MLLLFRFFSIWPLRALHALGVALGWTVWALSPRYRATFRSNVAQAGVNFEQARPAIAEAGPSDLVLIAGKGHEDYQILGTTKIHFDDREEAERALRSRPVAV